MNDLISRAEAIEAIENTDWYHQNQNKDMVHGANDDEHQAWYKAQDIYKALEAVPSADRPRGHWIDMADFEQCSVCHGTHLKEVDTYYGKAIWIKTDFCPNCGADMRGEDE